MNRRDFIGTTVGAAIAAALLPLLPTYRRTPLTLGQLMTISASAVAHAMGKPQYYLSPVEQRGRGGFVAWMCDRETGEKVPCVWTQNDEERHVTEIQKVDFVAAMLENAVHSLSDLQDQKAGRWPYGSN